MSGLTVDAVTVVRGDRVIVEDASMSVGAGEIVAVTGPSGSGKSTLLEVVAGLTVPQSGEVHLDDDPVWTGSGDPRPDVGFALQEPVLAAVLTIGENVDIAARSKPQHRQTATERTAESLARLEIGELADRMVGQVSGGQRQRATIARVLVGEPRLLVLDEPTSALDAHTRGVIIRELYRCASDGAIVVLATHDPEVAQGCDRIVAVEDGQLLEAVR